MPCTTTSQADAGHERGERAHAGGHEGAVRGVHPHGGAAKPPLHEPHPANRVRPVQAEEWGGGGGVRKQHTTRDRRPPPASPAAHPNSHAPLVHVHHRFHIHPRRPGLDARGQLAHRVQGPPPLEREVRPG